jgi:hypothetical protein
MDYHSLNDRCVVTGRCGRAGSTEIEWEAPREYELFVMKDRKGLTCLISIRDRDFAEFDPRHNDADDILMTEDYCFEITAVLKNPQ